MNMSFIDRKVSVNRTIAILAKNGIEIGDEEAAVILDFLYLISKNHNNLKEEKSTETLKRNRTSEKTL